MKSPTNGLRVAGVIFGLIALAHLIRVIAFVHLQIGSLYIRRSWSAGAAVVFAALCVWMWVLACTAAKSKAETPSAKPAA